MRKIFFVMLATTLCNVAGATPLEPMEGGGEAGVLVLQAVPGSPAERAGLKPADFVTHIGGSPVQDCVELTRLAKASSVDTSVTVRRAGQTLALDITLDEGAGRPRLGIRCPKPQSRLAAAFMGPYTVAVNAITNPGITMVRVTVVNGSSETIRVSPEMITAADGNQIMLKRIDNAAATAILVGHAEPSVRAAAEPMPAGKPIPQSLLTFVFDRIGVGGTTAAMASALIQTVATRKPTPSAPPPARPQELTKSMIDREALAREDLEPGNAAEGLVFFTEIQASPVSVMVNVGGRKIAFAFKAAADSAQPATAPDASRQ